MKINGTKNLLANDTILGKKNSDNITKSIQKQIKKTQEQITELASNETLSEKEKSVKKKVLQEQLESLNKQLAERQLEQQKIEQQKQLEAIQKKAEEAAKKDSQDNQENTGISTASMQALVSVSSSIEQAKSLNKVRTQLKGDAHVLQGEIAMAKSKGEDTSELQSQLKDLEKKIGEVSGKVIEKYKNASESMKAAMAQDQKDMEKASDKKVDETEEKDNEKSTETTGEEATEKTASDQEKDAAISNEEKQ